MPLADVLPEIVLLVGALSVVLVGAFLPRDRAWLAAPLSLALLGAALVLSIAGLATPTRATFSGTYAIDGLTGFGRILVLSATAVTVLLAPEWMREDRRHAEYYGVLLLAALGAILLAGASDTLQLVVAVLLSGVTGYTLSAYHRDWAISVEAGMKFFLAGAFANTFLLLGVVLLFAVTGSTGYAEIASAPLAEADEAVLAVAVLGITVGLAFELAAAPVHAWMPDVAQGAPAPSAAFLSVVPKIGAALALARFLDQIPTTALEWRPVVATLALATMTLGNLAALRQDDLRRMLGWSSVSQSGYSVMAICVLGLVEHALAALVVFLAAYAAANLAAFAAVTELRGRTALRDYRGMASERPAAAVALSISCLSLVGIPPLIGFTGKLMLFSAAIGGGYVWLAVAAVGNTVISLFYYLRWLGPMYFDARVAPVAVLGRWASIGMWAAAAATLGLGVAAELLLAQTYGITLVP